MCIRDRLRSQHELILVQQLRPVIRSDSHSILRKLTSSTKRQNLPSQTNSYRITKNEFNPGGYIFPGFLFSSAQFSLHLQQGLSFMKIQQTLQKCLDDWNRISGLDFCILDESNQVFASTGDRKLPSAEKLIQFREDPALCLSLIHIFRFLPGFLHG